MKDPYLIHNLLLVTCSGISLYDMDFWYFIFALSTGEWGVTVHDESRQFAFHIRKSACEN